MWIKLLGVVFAGVFIGAAAHEITSDRRRKKKEAQALRDSAVGPATDDEQTGEPVPGDEKTKS